MSLEKDLGQTTVDHIDGNPSNNRIENLRWASHSEQQQFAEASGTRASNASRRSKPVLGRKHGVEEEWVRYASAHEAARALGVSKGSIPRCCGKEGRTTGGYEFKYAEGNEPDVLPEEVWKPYESAWVSSLGRFRSTKGIVTTPKPARSGYVSVTINRKEYLLHRLMAVAFGLDKEEGH